MKIKINDLTYTVGLTFLGKVLKDEQMSIQEFFNEFQQNPLYIAPKLMRFALEKEHPELTADDVEEIVDGPRGFETVMKFIEEFSKTLETAIPQPASDASGKKKAAKLKTSTAI